MSSRLNDADVKKLKEDLFQRVADVLIEKLRDGLEREDHIFSGKARDSIQYYEDITTVGSELDYIRNIEYGRAAGSHVPIAPLKKWAMVKFGIPESEAYGVAKAIEKKIFEKGIPMTRFAKTAVEEMVFR